MVDDTFWARAQKIARKIAGRDRDAGDTGGMHGPSRLAEPEAGLPAPAELLREAAAPQLAGVRSLHDHTVATGLTPERLATILRNCVRGDLHDYLTLAEEMEERFPHYAAVLAVRKHAIAGIAPVVTGDSAKAAGEKVTAAVDTLIADPAFPDLVQDLLDGIAKGYSVCEIIWERRGELFWPREYVWRDPKYFTFDAISRSTLRLAELGMIDGVELPPGKFICHMPRLKSGIPIRAGLARSVAWMFMLASFTLKDWAIFLDIYGMPIRVGKYHPNATPDERRALLRAVTQIAADAGAIIPESMAIEFIETKASGSAPFEDAARHFNGEVSKLVIGQTQTSDHGSSRAQAVVHNEIRLEIKIADARQMAKTINRDLVAWFVALNFGADVPRPVVDFPVPKPADIAVLAAALAELVPLGLQVDQNEVRAKLGLATPAADATLLKAPPGARPVLDKAALPTPKALGSAHGFGCRCGGCATAQGREAALGREAAPAMDELDELQAETGDWEPQLMPFIRAILAAAQKCATYEQFAVELDTLQGAMPGDALEARLAIATLKARGLGDGRDVG